ncbi:hypothetical protein AVEN_222202-1 [Araneus ventricosus]|uniref:Uncharacterized protein n=1 Tax=Araneus ventricosus TaxID=182803 RepID=A0A4Y2SM95_ARAVE|nr:hypothetical protein AVEN_222202-1 [Araneus ventricosus]
MCGPSLTPGNHYFQTQSATGAEYKAIETELEKLRGKRNLIPIGVELNCGILKIESDVEEKMRDIEYNSLNSRKIAKALKENYIYRDSKLREFNSERNHARKIFQTYRHPVIQRKLIKLNKQINKLDQKIETDDFTNELLNVNATDGTVWKFVAPFKKKTKNVPSVNGPAVVADTDLEKANFLAESLETHSSL